MKKQYPVSLGVALMFLLAGWASAAFAEDKPAAPAEDKTAVAAPAATDDQAEAPADKAAADDNLDNLEFASGEATSFDAGTKKLQVKVYLDDAGNPAENTVDLTLTSDTEITNGEKDLDSSALKAGVEIDVEYDKNTKKATYIFVY